MFRDFNGIFMHTYDKLFQCLLSLGGVTIFWESQFNMYARREIAIIHILTYLLILNKEQPPLMA